MHMVLTILRDTIHTLGICPHFWLLRMALQS